MARCNTTIVSWLLATSLFAQTKASFVYVESFRKGAAKITESSNQMQLDRKNPFCQVHVKDQSSRERYLFVCEPQRVGQGDERITGWQVRLEDTHHKIYPNVLMANPDPTQDQAQIGWLDPGKFAKIPLTAERVIKVDNFYCVVQVKDYHFISQEQPYLDRMTVEVSFTNRLPHSQVRAKEE